MGVSKRLYMGVSTHTYDDVLTHLHTCVLQRRPLIVAERQRIAHGKPAQFNGQIYILESIKMSLSTSSIASTVETITAWRTLMHPLLTSYDIF